MRGKVRDRMLRVLANNPLGDMSKYEIARQAVATYPWVREFFLKLENMGIVKDTKVLDYPALLRYWQLVHKYRVYVSLIMPQLGLFFDLQLHYNSMRKKADLNAE